MLLFLFDMDDVLYDYDYAVRMDRLAEMTGVERTELRRRWWDAGHERVAEAGGYATEADYLAAFAAAVGVEASAADWLAARRAAMTPRAEVLDVVRLAAGRGQVSLLTNNGALVSAHLTELAPDLVPLFGEHLFTSSDYGVRKPDPAVFVRAMERYAASPAETFFVDDLPENIAGAVSVGITAHLYRDPTGLRAAVLDFAVQCSELPSR